MLSVRSWMASYPITSDLQTGKFSGDAWSYILADDVYLRSEADRR